MPQVCESQQIRMWTTPDAPARYQRGLKFGLNADYGMQVF
jgi:hypothetical protein